MTAVTKVRPFPGACESEKNQNPESTAPLIRTARVLSLSSDHILVETAEERVRAQKAFSCFAEPLPEDQVILCRDEQGTAYILGIVQRPSGRDLVLSYPVSTDMVCRGRHLRLRAKQSLSLTSDELSLFSKKAVHKSREAMIAYDESTAVGRCFTASMDSVKIISQMIHSMAKQMMGSFQGYIRTTETNDQVRAGQMTRKAEGMYAMDSQYTLMNSKKDTKIDGERIHMG